MKQLFLLLYLFIATHYTAAGEVKHKPNPKAKALNDSAAKKYQETTGDIAKLQKIFPLLDAAIKIDSYYYEAWNNRLALQGQLDQFENEFQALKTMSRLFPFEEDVQFSLGILEYKTGRNKEALATFNKLLDHYNKLLERNKNNTNTRGLLYYKGIVLILIDKVGEGKAIMTKLFNEEQDPWKKSGIGFYINSSRQEIINDRIPGK